MQQESKRSLLEKYFGDKSFREMNDDGVSSIPHTFDDIWPLEGRPSVHWGALSHGVRHDFYLMDWPGISSIYSNGEIFQFRQIMSIKIPFGRQNPITKMMNLTIWRTGNPQETIWKLVLSFSGSYNTIWVVLVLSSGLCLVEGISVKILSK